MTSQQRYLPFGGVRTDVQTPNSPATDYGYTGQRSLDVDMGGLMDYRARFYSSYLNHFTQPDTIVSNPLNPQSLNRYSYALNNPIRNNDPSGHKPCNNVGADGCKDTKEEKNLEKLMDFVDRRITNKKGKDKPKSLESMEMVVRRAAQIYGDDWNSFLDATTFVFTGYYGHGAGTMRNAHSYASGGLIDGDSGFHPDFRDYISPQVRHFWAGFATAANPTGDNPNGVEVALWGNNYHEINQDTVLEKDGASVNDYALTLTAIDIAKQTGNQIKTPSDLVAVLHDRLSKDGPGYIGQSIDPNLWWTPDN